MNSRIAILGLAVICLGIGVGVDRPAQASDRTVICELFVSEY